MTKNSIVPVGLAALVAIGGWKAYEAGIFRKINENVVMPLADKVENYKIGLDDNPMVMQYGGNPDANNIGGCGLGLGALVGTYLIGSALMRKKEKQ